MRLIRIVAASTIVLSLAGCGGKEVKTASPKGIPYVCEDGRPMRVVYEGGGARGRAKLMFDGGTFEMMAAPAINDLRYASETGLNEGMALVWTTDGTKGALSEVPAAQAGLGDERPIVSCTRLGWDGETITAADVPEAHDSHAEESH
jgi:hypothetical protein